MKKSILLVLASMLPLAACQSTNEGCGEDCANECCADTNEPMAEGMAMTTFELGRVP